jgi:hypothetical protein
MPKKGMNNAVSFIMKDILSHHKQSHYWRMKYEAKGIEARA